MNEWRYQRSQLSARDRRKKKAEGDAADPSGAKELTIRILKYVAVCCERVYKREICL